MRALQACGSAVIRAVLITGCLLVSVKGDGADTEEQIEIKYALIGGGIGLFLAVVFVVSKIWIIRKLVCENNSERSMKRPSEPNVVFISAN